MFSKTVNLDQSPPSSCFSTVRVASRTTAAAGRTADVRDLQRADGVKQRCVTIKVGCDLPYLVVPLSLESRLVQKNCGSRHKCTFCHKPLPSLKNSTAQRRLKMVPGRSRIDINGSDSRGMTPLHYAANSGSWKKVTVLLENGASVHAVNADDATALHISSESGYHAISHVLLEAGAHVDAVDKFGHTPLSLSIPEQHVMATVMLLKAGANVNHRRMPKGETPLFDAALHGSLETVKVLLRAGANPVLSKEKDEGRDIQTFLYQTNCVPLDMAAQNGHDDVVRELLAWSGLNGCGGSTKGVLALLYASKGGHFATMTTLLDAGVVDNGEALCATCKFGGEEAVKILLERRADDLDEYIRCRAEAGHNTTGLSPISCLFHPTALRPSSRRLMRRLLDAGAETDIDGPILRCRREDRVMIMFQSLGQYADFLIREVEDEGGSGAEDKLRGLKGMRSLLLQEDAVHATSWLWGKMGSGKKTKTKKLSTLVRWKKGAARPRVLSKALTRCVRCF